MASVGMVHSDKTSTFASSEAFFAHLILPGSMAPRLGRNALTKCYWTAPGLFTGGCAVLARELHQDAVYAPMRNGAARPERYRDGSIWETLYARHPDQSQRFREHRQRFCCTSAIKPALDAAPVMPSKAQMQQDANVPPESLMRGDRGT